MTIYAADLDYRYGSKTESKVTARNRYSNRPEPTDIFSFLFLMESSLIHLASDDAMLVTYCFKELWPSSYSGQENEQG